MKKKYLVSWGLFFCALSLNAQQLKEGYVEWGQLSENFSSTLSSWEKGKQVTEDDNFFISRVKPKVRFRNTATQVNKSLDETNDKKLVYWVPINKPPFNALPDGVFDSEVFPMWSYITHYGNWTAPFVRMPGNFADVAHKNGVGVSVVAGIPYGSPGAWAPELRNLVNIGSEKMGDFLEYYGVDGLGYNSEFSGLSDVLPNLRTMHEELVKRFKTDGKNPVFENFWYDGTNDTGSISFDRGLGSHNDDTFGDKDHPRTSLFFNYNWNNASLMDQSVANAIKMGRDPLDLYCGFNMQGAEPKYGTRWPYLTDRRLSIGLWGAHSENMPFESRGEKGATPDVQQRTYMLRVERWFTGGSRNPVNTPEVSNLMTYNADNVKFHGMSKFMTARSALKWDLAEEPFITYFNLGNGTFFNWNGERQNDNEWYNIGVQDHLPTWRWWFADKFLGNTAADVPANGLDAEFIWTDAWMGGSLMRIYGTTSNEYLHLFKTEFTLAGGDEITVRYKVMKGNGDVTLALSAKGNESSVLVENAFKVLSKDDVIEEGKWIEKKFILRGQTASLIGKDLAVVALHFQNAKDLNIHLGEFSIIRGTQTSTTPAIPVIAKTEVFGSQYKGVDAKIIFNMPNDKGNEVCYNLDVKTSLFKLYAQQEGKNPILMGTTTSWAGLYFSVPIDFTMDEPKVRFGVSAVSLDMKSESAIAWDDYKDTGNYQINDDITIDKTTIKPNESFVLSYIDPKHESGTWRILDSKGTEVKSFEGSSFVVNDGIKEIGNYTVELTGKVADAEGNRVDQTRRWPGYVQITDEKVGAVPQILSLTANDKTEDIQVEKGDAVALKYTGRKADGQGSRGVALHELAFGFKAEDMEMQPYQPFTVSFWLKINQFIGGTQLLSIRDKQEDWPKTDWGWVWNFCDKEGKFTGVTFRGSDGSNNNELKYYYDNLKIEAGPWTYFTYVFDFNDNQQISFDLYINGEKQEPTGWSRSNPGHDKVNPGHPGFKGDLYPMNPGNKIAIGGSQKDNGGVDGTLDNYQYWNKALTAEEVKQSMGDLDPKNLPADLYGFWSLEQEPANDGTFANEGTFKNKAVPAGLHDYNAEGGEGQGHFQWQDFSGYPGCPFISGTSFPVVTVPTWNIEKAEISAAEGNDQEGQAIAKWVNDGIYTATLTLENGWGKDSKTFQFITVGKGSGIENLEVELAAYPNPFIDHVNVRFDVEGEYTVRIYDLNGVLFGEKVQHVSAGEFMQIGVNGHTGSYVAQILKNGKLVRAVKLLKK